jgi:hypothetical protein
MRDADFTELDDKYQALKRLVIALVDLNAMMVEEPLKIPTKLMGCQQSSKVQQLKKELEG